MHFLGLAGMPRRCVADAAHFTDIHALTSVGAFVSGLAQVYFLLWVLLSALRRGPGVESAVARALSHLLASAQALATATRVVRWRRDHAAAQLAAAASAQLGATAGAHGRRLADGVRARPR